MRAFVVVCLLCASVAHAEPPPVVLRMAAAAPDGTGWAREVKAFSRDVTTATSGRVQVKWYLGGIAGDEMQVVDRIRRGQLDGQAAALSCERLAPSLRAMRIVGLFQTREEHRFVLQRLRARIDAEFAKSGFEALALASFGMDHLFLKQPVHTFAELKQQRLWVWDLDDMLKRMGTDMAMRPVPLPLQDARAALDDNRIDGFIAIPAAMLAFQWSTRVRAFLDLHVSQLTGCMVIASRAFDRLPPVLRDDVRGAAAKFTARFEEVGRLNDAELLNGLFQKQGLQKITASESLRASFFAAARAARAQIPNQLVPRELIDQVLSLLADFRAEHTQ